MSLAGFWEFPGGKLEEGESPETCLIREIKEELGIVIRIIEPLTPSVYSYSENKNIQLLPFLCSWESGEINLVEHEKIVWITTNEINDLTWAPADIPIAKELSENWQVFRSKA